jgi:hypothetical protein
LQDDFPGVPAPLWPAGIQNAQFALNRREGFSTLAKLMGAQWKQAGREINALKKGQMVVKP